MDLTRRFRLGILALIAGGLFLGLLLFVLEGVLRTNLVSYYILFEENVKGMVVGSRVNFQGVPLGMVKDIRFQNGRTMVELSVDPEKAVIQDVTRARLDRLLVTGQVTVELEGYGPEGKPLRPGLFIAPKQDPLNALARSLPEVLGDVQNTFVRLDAALERVTALLGEDNQQRIGAILQHAEQTAAALPSAVRRLDATLQRAESSLGAIERLAPEASAALTDLRALEASAGSAMRELDQLLGSVRAPVQSVLASMRNSLDEVRGLARTLRLAPDSLLFGVARPAAPTGGSR